MLGTLRRILTAVGLAGGLAVTGAAADPIRVNFVPISDGLPLFVAEDQGFFDKRGLDVELTAAPNVIGVKTSLVIRDAKDEPGVPFEILEARLAETA